jgi:hypothetical protein
MNRGKDCRKVGTEHRSNSLNDSRTRACQDEDKNPPCDAGPGSWDKKKDMLARFHTIFFKDTVCGRARHSTETVLYTFHRSGMKIMTKSL